MTYLPSQQDSSSGSLDDGSVIVSPSDDLQTTINNNAVVDDNLSEPMTRIRLQSGKDYTINGPIDIKPHVILDCNGARILPGTDADLFRLYGSASLLRPYIACHQAGFSYTSTAITIGAPAADKVEAFHRATVEDMYIKNTRGQGSALMFLGGDGDPSGSGTQSGGDPCSMQYANGYIDGFQNGVHIYASGDAVDGQGNWANGNRFDGTVRGAVNAVRMESEGAATSGNIINMMFQSASSGSGQPATRWLVKMDDDPRDPSTTDFSDNLYVKRGNLIQAYAWDWSNAEENNPYFDSTRDRRAPLWYLGRGKQYQNALIDWSGSYGNEFVVNNTDVNPKENGILSPHGWDVRGAQSFSVEPTYQTDAATRDYHAGGRN
jgi:hypothetical protein